MGSPWPKATQLVCGRSGLAHEALETSIPGWDLKALKEEMADVRVGLAQPPSCTPTLPLAETLALILVSGHTASSCGTQGHGSCPHLSSALTGSMMAPQTWEGLPLGGKPLIEWPFVWAGPAWLRPARPRWPPHSGDLLPPDQLRCVLFGSSPSLLALLLPPGPLFLPPGRGGSHSWFPLMSALPHRHRQLPLCTGPLLGIRQLPHSLWPPLPELETPQPHREICQAPPCPTLS